MTVLINVIHEGRTVPLSDLSEAERKDMQKSMKAKVEKVLSDYFSVYPEEIKKLKR